MIARVLWGLFGLGGIALGALVSFEEQAVSLPALVIAAGGFVAIAKAVEGLRGQSSQP